MRWRGNEDGVVCAKEKEAVGLEKGRINKSESCELFENEEGKVRRRWDGT
jgi:hypothetical protein